MVPLIEKKGNTRAYDVSILESLDHFLKYHSVRDHPKATFSES